MKDFERWVLAFLWAAGLFLWILPPSWIPMWEFFRVATGAAVGLLLPGYLLLRCFRQCEDEDFLARAAFAAGLSFVVLSLLSIVLLEGGGHVGLGVRLLLGLEGGLLALGWRKRRLDPRAGAAQTSSLFWGVRAETIYLLVVLISLVTLGRMLYRLGGSFPSAEEIVLSRKMFESLVLSPGSIMYRPDIPWTYVYAPFAFMEALIARLSGLELILVLLRFRFLVGGLAILTLYALGKTLFGSRAVGSLSALAAVILAMLDPHAWSQGLGVLVPYLNRTGIASALLLPLACLFALKGRNAQGAPFWIVSTACFGVGLLIVHGREGIHFLVFLASVLSGYLLLLRSERQAIGRLLAILLGTLALAVLFRARQAAVVGHLGLVIDPLRDQTRELFVQILSHPGQWLTAALPKEIVSPVGSYPFEHYQSMFSELLRGSVRYFLALSLFLTPALLFFRRAAWAVILFFSITLPLAVVKIPVLYVGFVALCGYPDAGMILSYLFPWCLFVFVGFFLYGILLLAERLVRLFRMPTAPQVGPVAWLEGAVGILALVLVGSAFASYWGLRPLLYGAAQAARTQPAAVFGWILLASAVVLFLKATARRTQAVEEAMPPLRTPFLSLLIFVSFLLPAVGASERVGEPLWVQFRTEKVKVKNVARPYAELTRYLESDIPADVMEHLRTKLPPRQMFLYDPDHILAIAQYSSHYIAHAGTRNRLSTDLPYLSRYVREGNHPIFNFQSSRLPDPRSLEFIRDYRIDYILVNPKYHRHLARVFAHWNRQALVFSKSFGSRKFALYRVNHEALSEILQSR